MIFNILDNTTELWMTKYIIGEIFSSGGTTFYKNPSDQTVTFDILLPLRPVQKWLVRLEFVLDLNPF